MSEAHSVSFLREFSSCVEKLKGKGKNREPDVVTQSLRKDSAGETWLFCVTWVLVRAGVEAWWPR
jgi:hypothetical protein